MPLGTKIELVTMSKSKLIRLLAILVLVVGLVALAIVRAASPSLCEANISQVTVGMTYSDVVNLLGIDSGDYSGDLGILSVPDDFKVPKGECKQWLGPNLGVYVWFDESNTVAEFYRGDVFHFRHDCETPIERIWRKALNILRLK